MEYIVNDENNIRIDSYLAKTNDKYSRTYIQKLMNENLIFVNGQNIKSSYKVKQGDKILVEEKEVEKSTNVSQDIAIDVIYEDDDILIVNKEKGMVVHPRKWK